jgi:hypothetical protein
MAIRHGVFETNSSSTHSVSISRSDVLTCNISPDIDGVLRLDGGQFGWEQEEYNDAWTKANYCAVFTSSEGAAKERAMLNKVLMEVTGAKRIKYCFSYNYNTSVDDEGDTIHYAYIDHQSDFHEGGDCLSAFESEQTLKGFIFNCGSTLTTDNDNH